MNFKGLGVAMITPFDDKGKVDYDSIPLIVENIISGGADYLVLMGTTAEVPCLSSKEKKNIVKIVSKVNHNRLPMIIGIGGNTHLELFLKLVKLIYHFLMQYYQFRHTIINHRNKVFIPIFQRLQKLVHFQLLFIMYHQELVAQ